MSTRDPSASEAADYRRPGDPILPRLRLATVGGNSPTVSIATHAPNRTRGPLADPKWATHQRKLIPPLRFAPPGLNGGSGTRISFNQRVIQSHARGHPRTLRASGLLPADRGRIRSTGPIA